MALQDLMGLNRAGDDAPTNPVANLNAMSDSGLDPRTQYLLASMGMSPDDTNTAAQGLETFNNTLQLKTTLLAHEPDEQKKIWDGLDEKQQNALNQVQYNPPEPKHGGGFWKSFGKVAGGAVGEGLHGIWQPSHAVGWAGGEALNLLNKGVSQISHIGRTEIQLNDKPGASWGENASRMVWTHIGPGIFSHSFSDWQHAWSDTGNPNTSIAPSVKKEVIDNYGQDTYDLALGVMRAKGNYDKVVAKAAPEDQDKLKQQLGAPDFQKALARMSAGKTNLLASMLPVQQSGFANFKQDTKGPSVFGAHPFNGEVLNQLGDVAMQWYLDPVSVAGNIRTVQQAKYFNLANGNDVYRVYNQSKAAQTAAQVIADTWRKGGAAGLIERHPNLAPYTDKFVKANPQNAGDVVKIFAQTADAVSTAAGKAIVPAVNLPHTTAFGKMLTDLKVGAKGAIDLSADQRLGQTLKEATEGDSRLQHIIKGLESAPGIIAKRFTTLTTNQAINPDDASSITQIYRYLNTYLDSDTAKQLTNAWASATTVGMKKAIFKSIVDTNLRASGMPLEARTEFLKKIDGALAGTIDATTDTRQLAKSLHDGRAYGSDGSTLMHHPETGDAFEAGHLANHASNLWVLPNFKKLHQAAAKGLLTQGLDVFWNNAMFDKAIQEAWKPVMLWRTGFPIRVGLEEVLNHVVRNGLASYVKSRGALTFENRNQAMLHNTLDKFLGHIPDEYVDDIKAGLESGYMKPEDLIAHSFGWHAYNALEHLADRFGPSDYINAVRNNPDLFRSNAYHDVSAGEGRLGMYGDENPVMIATAKSGGRVIKKNRITGGGEYDPAIAPTDPTYIAQWHAHIKELTNDPRTKYIMEELHPGHIAKTSESDILKHTADMLENDPEFTNKMVRSVMDSNKNRVGVEINQRQALEDWARVNHLDVLKSTFSPKGEPIQAIYDAISEGRLPTLKELQAIPFEDLPKAIKGQRYQYATQHWWNDVINFGFDKVATPLIDWISREPQYLHETVKATKLMEEQKFVEGLQKLGMTETEAKAQAADRASHMAADAMKPFIHDPQVRSQASIVMRNIAPFMFAQEQFYKRWIRTAVIHPQGIRHAQILLGGIKQLPFEHKDENGNPVLMIPGGNIVAKVMRYPLQLFMGDAAKVPLAHTGFTLNPKWIIPGTGDGGLSLGPIASQGLNMASHRFPELEKVNHEIQGDLADQSPIAAVVPGWARRMSALLPEGFDVADKAQLTAAGIAYMKYMKSIDISHEGEKGYTPLVPDESADKHTKDVFNNRVTHGARMVLVLQGIYGFTTPGAPQVKIDRNNLSQDWRAAQNANPNFDDALKSFIEKHPDGTPYTLASSKTLSGHLPASHEALQYITKHKGVVEKYPYAASYLVPQKSDVFDQASYQEEMAAGLRSRKTLQEFEDDMYYQQAADQFYRIKKAFDLKVDATHGPEKQLLQNKWSEFTDAYKLMHPTFANEYVGGAGDQRRLKVMNDIRGALADPATPNTPETKALRQLVAHYDEYALKAKVYSNFTSTRATRAKQALSAQFTREALQFVKNNPNVEGFFKRNIEPDLPANKFTTPLLTAYNEG